MPLKNLQYISRFLLCGLLLFLMGGCGSGTTSTSENGQIPQLTVSGFEANTDTIEFHIGSPLFLRLSNSSPIACEPFNGRHFLFDEKGGQLGWGFVEVSDSLLFPRQSCTRYLMLTSEQSNLIAEGYYRMSVVIFLNEKEFVASDTIVLHPVYSDKADAESYSQFILEQIYQKSPLLRDGATQEELFSDHLPHSYASEIYRAVIQYQNGNPAESSHTISMADKKYGSRPSNSMAWVTRNELQRRLSTLLE